MCKKKKKTGPYNSVNITGSKATFTYYTSQDMDC